MPNLIKCLWYVKKYTSNFIFLGSGIPKLENRVTDYDVKNVVKLNCDVIADFLLIFRNSKFLMKIKFPSYVTRKFYLHLITLKFPSYATREFKFHLKFRVTSLKESFESLRKVFRKQLWLTSISGFLFDRFAILKACILEHHYKPK